MSKQALNNIQCVVSSNGIDSRSARNPHRPKDMQRQPAIGVDIFEYAIRDKWAEPPKRNDKYGVNEKIKPNHKASLLGARFHEGRPAAGIGALAFKVAGVGSRVRATN